MVTDLINRTGLRFRNGTFPLPILIANLGLFYDDLSAELGSTQQCLSWDRNRHPQRGWGEHDGALHVLIA